MDHRKRTMIVILLTWWHFLFQSLCSFYMYYLCVTTILLSRRRLSDKSYTMDFHKKRAHLRTLVYSSDTTCIEQLRMNRSSFDASTSATQMPNVLASESTSSGKRKRKASVENLLIGQLEKVVVTFGEGFSDFMKTTEKMSSIMATWGFDEILHERRSQFFQILGQVEGLARTERLAASIKIPADPSLLSVFPTIPDDDKAEWILMVLG